MKIAGTTNYFQISADGGTGGGIFRKMYGDFLIKTSDTLKHNGIREVGLQFITLADKWDIVAGKMWELSQSGQESLLNHMSKDITELHHLEYDALSKLAQICKMCIQKIP